MGISIDEKPLGYTELKNRKKTGAHYTPTNLADFVASHMVACLDNVGDGIGVMDPAIGDGELLRSLTTKIHSITPSKIKAMGFDIDANAIREAKKQFENIEYAEVSITCNDFLEYVISRTKSPLFQTTEHTFFDAIIANPPYVRTQVLGAEKSQELSKEFGISGRVDLYYSFILGIAKVLKPGGILGIIVSNRFMTTKSGKDIRDGILKYFEVLHVWDFGDTKLFDAAVLPSVLLLRRKKDNNSSKENSKFTTIYSTNMKPNLGTVSSVFEAIELEGVVEVSGKGNFLVKQGSLDSNGVWKITNEDVDNWLAKVTSHTKLKFSDVGKIRVGVKTTADNVFILSKESDTESIELINKLTTHHVSRRFKPKELGFKYIVYPHKVVNGRKQAVDINDYPRTKAYLLEHKDQLQSRKYINEAKRNWYEIWVPQDPDKWRLPKVVFRDISSEPIFWLDLEGTVVNGDCYWITSDSSNMNILWLLLAVANSKFIEQFYDHKFNNKLYSGRRRFITQYVENFPLPDPESENSKEIVRLTKELYDAIPNTKNSLLEETLNTLVWKAFGF